MRPLCSQALSATRCQWSRLLFARDASSFDDPVSGQNRRNAFYAKLCRLLHNEVHALAARDALDEVGA